MDVTIDELCQDLPTGVCLIDVREPTEFAECRIPGAQLIPLGALMDRQHELPRDARIYMVCQTGRRSAMATDYLRRQGFDAVNVSGGTSEWAMRGLPVEAGVPR